jgi:hypothetical protein
MQVIDLAKQALENLLQCPALFTSDRQFLTRILAHGYDFSSRNALLHLIKNLERQTLCTQAVAQVRQTFFGNTQTHERHESLSQQQIAALNWVTLNLPLTADDWKELTAIIYAGEISSRNRYLLEDFFRRHINRLPDHVLFAFLGDGK